MAHNQKRLSRWIEKNPDLAKKVLDDWYANERPKAMQKHFDDLRPAFEERGWIAHPEDFSFTSPSGSAGYNVNVEFWWAEWWRQHKDDANDDSKA